MHAVTLECVVIDSALARWLAWCTHLTLGLDSDIKPQSSSLPLPPLPPPSPSLTSYVEDGTGLWLETKWGGGCLGEFMEIEVGEREGGGERQVKMVKEDSRWAD